MKKTFNVTDLTKKVLGTEDTHAIGFEATRRNIERHIKAMQKFLGLPQEKFEAPIEQLDDYVQLMKELLFNSDNDELLDLLTKKIWKGKKLDDSIDGDSLKKLIELFANLEKRKVKTEKEEVIFDKWLQDQLSDDYYIESQKQLTYITNLIKEDFSFFDNLTSLDSKLKFLEQYINDIRMISSLYKQQVEEELLFESCFLEVVSSHDDVEKKLMYTLEDYFALPPDIQFKIQTLIEQKRREKSP